MSALLPIRRNLAARLALVLGLLSLIVVVTMGLGIYLLTARYLERQAEADLASLADFYAVYTASTAPDETRLAALAPQIASFFAPQAGYDVRIFGVRSGALLAATREIGALPSRAALEELGPRRPSLFLAASEDQPGRIYTARSVAAADGTAMAVIEVSRDVSATGSFLSALRLVLIGSGGLALLAALAGSLFLARHIARPLRQMESATGAIAGGDFGRRLPITSEDEIGRLAGSINRMAQDLARLEAARREFIAKISHDLRTPLTAIKGFVVNLQDTAPAEMQPTLSTMDQQTDRLIRLVNDLLTLSRLQRGELQLQRAPTDLAQVARSAATLAGAKAERLGVTLSLDLPGNLTLVSGDADRLEQVAVNLLDNAIKFTPPGDTVQIRLVEEDRQVILRVLDDGRGPTEEEATRAFEPYYRGPQGGAGLGLSIAREIVSAHGGQIWLRARPEGGGEAGFSLPCEGV
jgi:two-component system sensor histidine kinase BaeS